MIVNRRDSPCLGMDRFENVTLTALDTINISNDLLTNFFNVPYVVVSYVMCYSIAIWTVTVHSLVLLCFFINRQSTWIHKSKGIICLVVTDLCSGVGFLGLVFVQTHTRIGMFACLLSLGNYMTTQLATNLQVLRLCLQRFVAVLSSTRIHAEGTMATTVQFILIYMFSFGVNAVCLNWIKFKNVYNVCNLEGVVEENMQTVCIFMLMVLSLPTIVCDTVYFIIIFQLRKKSRAVAPVLLDIPTPQPAGSTVGKPDVNVSSAEQRFRLSSNVAAKKYFNKAVTTIGLVLLLNNMALFPFFMTLTYHVIRPKAVAPIYVWFGSALVLQLNSALSPFVYCLRVKVIYRAFKNMLICCK